MTQKLERLLYVVVVVTATVTFCDKSFFDWVPRDNYDKIDSLMTAIQKVKNCKGKSQLAMTLPKASVSQIPRANQLLNKIWYKNRTALVHMHNMALNRAFFYSYIFQKLNKSWIDLQYQPGWFYYYVSVTADTNANKGIFNASALMFDHHTYYHIFDYNRTLPLFGVRSFRFDDTFDMGVILREPTGRTTLVQDIGAIGNYSYEGYKMAPWFKFWLPDNEPIMDSVQKFAYSVNVKYANGTGRWLHDKFQSTSFFGPNSPGIKDKDEKYMPVRFTDPYYDCKMSNKWIVSAVSPIVDYMPRYTYLRSWLRRQKFVGVAVMDIDFLEIDFNACPVSIGNPGPSFLSGVSKCETKTTQCKPVSGKGFKRGAYTCFCNSGYSYPPRVVPPWKGGDLENAIEFEKNVGFTCRPTEFLRVLSVVNKSDINVNVAGDSRSDIFLTDRFSGRQLKSVNASQFYGPVRREEAVKRTDQLHSVKRVAVQKDYINQKFSIREEPLKKKKKKRRRRKAQYDQMNFDRMQGIFTTIKKINTINCRTFSTRTMLLPGDVGYGVSTQFDTQARFALRISHLLSNWFQNSIHVPTEDFHHLKGGSRIHQELLFGEVLANVMGDYKVLSSGIYFEPHVFEDWNGKTREFFGPFAWKREKSVYAIDTAGFKSRYTDEDWYVRIRQRWQTNTEGVLKYRMKAKVRSDIEGSKSVNFEYYPMEYEAPSVTHGIWTQPYFRCDGRVDAWVITYAVPIIGLDSLRSKLKFKGVVTVDVPLQELEINQCYQPFNIQNAFKSTARCHYPSQTCSPIAGYKFTRGGYKCTCRQGYEYPFKDGRNFFLGSLVDVEYEKKMAGLFNLYDSLKCRTQGVSMVICNIFTVVVMTIIAVFSKNL